jgi:hypothetical protein
MTVSDRIRVRVSEELVLDAGTCEEISGPDGPERLIRPPEATLFHQVLAYLQEKPNAPQRTRGASARWEGAAATAVFLRWGSYLAVLLDRDKPVWSAAAVPDGASRISDAEIARINIEASAALAEWIDLHRADDGGRLYAELVNRAIAYLPMPRRAPQREAGSFAALADPELAARLVGASDPARVARVRADAERHPSRVLANAFVNVAWRNGPIENIHAGRERGYPLGQRRATPAEEAELMRFANVAMTLGMTVLRQLSAERPRRPWSEQVLPFGLAHMWLVTPSGWTLTETSREVRLPSPGPEPAARC